MGYPVVSEPGRIDLDGGGVVHYLPGYLPRGEAGDAFRLLLREIPWAQREITVYARRHPEPRLTCWMAPPPCSYRYSGILLHPSPWHPLVAAWRDRLAEETGHALNSVLANLYRDGRDGVSWHADNESCFPPDPPVASLSLGATRRFLLRHRRKGTTLEWHLGHGDLLVMEGPVQSTHVHQVPRTARPAGPRLNFTFRRFLAP